MGFWRLATNVDFLYKCTDFYAPQHERVMRWNDPDLGIEWPLPLGQAAGHGARCASGIRRGRVSSMSSACAYWSRAPGQLGQACCDRARRTLTARFRTPSSTSGARRSRAVVSIRPHVIINAAAYTAVDQAESDEADARASTHWRRASRPRAASRRVRD